MLDRWGALRLLRVHFFNDRVDGVARDDRSRASMSRKASKKFEVHLLLADLAFDDPSNVVLHGASRAALHTTAEPRIASPA
jgi:hypothetical protein